MFRTTQHPRLIDAARQAETLHRFRIKPWGDASALWRQDPEHGWLRIGIFHAQLDAEDYLFSKLPCIESEL